MGYDINNGVVRLQGFDDLARKLREIPRQLRRTVMRTSLQAGARIVRDEARRNAPVLRSAVPYRSPGTLRRAISVRTSKVARREGNVGVFVNVRPLTGARRSNLQVYKQRGKFVSRVQNRIASSGRNPKDPFYWRFLEFGWTPRSRIAGLVTKKDRYHSRRRGTARQIAGRHFLESGAKKLPEALVVIQARLKQWFDKIQSTGNLAP